MLADHFRWLLNFKLFKSPLLQLENHDQEILYMINTSKDMRSESVAMWHSGILCVCAYPKVVLGNTFMHHMLVSASFAALDELLWILRGYRSWMWDTKNWSVDADFIRFPNYCCWRFILPLSSHVVPILGHLRSYICQVFGVSHSFSEMFRGQRWKCKSLWFGSQEILLPSS